jgi:hypothetical protein
VATEENPMPDELKPEPRADFAADFRDGEAMAREWIAGRGDLPDLTLIVKDMPRDLGGLEAGFLATIDVAVRGARRGEAGAPDVAKGQLALTPPAEPLIDIDELHRRQRERAVATKLEELGSRNQALFVEQQRPFMGGNLPKDADGHR